MAKAISQKTISRLSMYRRLIRDLLADGTQNVYSHQLAARCGVTSAQVRRDLMSVGYTGSPNRGYEVRALLEAIAGLLDPPSPENVALVGVGNLGRAILAYFAGRSQKLRIMAAFDRDTAITGRIIHGCRCYSIDEAGEVIPRLSIQTAILTVPAKEAQPVADILLAAGVKGLLNFAPARLRVPADVCVENMDFTISLEKVAYFARSPTTSAERRND